VRLIASPKTENRLIPNHLHFCCCQLQNAVPACFSHSALHTFATTITLSQGMAIETISKLLGHKNIRTTQIYATITHSKLDGDMERLSKRLDTLYRDTDLEKVRERL
jgi:hypothetical protein